MKRSFVAFLGLAVVFSLVAWEAETRACGGCAGPVDANTQVTGHRMIFAVSKTQTTLYDQIEYSGAPESFAWFLPIKGEVQVGLSADALFAILDSYSRVTVLPPQVKCPDVPGEVSSGSASSSDHTQYPGEEQVSVLHAETVGPYETVQLSATTSGALTSWLAAHGYFVPSAVEPVIAAYQEEGFDFLAMKLVPGEGVKTMRPVRITTPGAGMTLPLRMVAAGTGVFTPVLLHVVSEGRYEIANRPNLTVDSDLVIWNWNDNTSNYRSILESLTKGGLAWVTESSWKVEKTMISSSAEGAVMYGPGETGWGDPAKGLSAIDDAMADVDTLFDGMKGATLTRLYAKLSRTALLTDLTLQASKDQHDVGPVLRTKRSIGTPPCLRGTSDCSLSASPREGGAAAALATGLLAAFAWLRRRRGWAGRLRGMGRR